MLASDIAAHREVAAGHATLLPVGDLDAWAHALAGSGHSVRDVRDRSDAGRRHAAAHTWERCALAHLEAWTRSSPRNLTCSICAVQ